MPRRPRIVIPKLAYHVTQRGNYRQKVFEKEADYKQYSYWLNEYAQQNNLSILAYCLMNNHVHFIVVPDNEESLARTFNTVHMRYAQYYNRKKKAHGHLWQGRFFSYILDTDHLYRAIRYVERNPVRAKIVKKAWDYPWSSAKMHIGEDQNPRITLSSRFEMMDEKSWRGYLHEEDEEINKEIRLKTLRGLVVGTQEFISRLEERLNCSLKCLSQGRPKRA